MRLLLDAHALLWFVWGHANLSVKARDLMADPGNELLLGAGTIWEIAIKVGLRKLQLAEPFDIFLSRAMADNDLNLLPITVAHGSVLVGLPFHHRDPFDRLLVAQSIAEKAPVISADIALDAYGIHRI